MARQGRDDRTDYEVTASSARIKFSPGVTAVRMYYVLYNLERFQEIVEEDYIYEYAAYYGYFISKKMTILGKVANRRHFM